MLFVLALFSVFGLSFAQLQATLLDQITKFSTPFDSSRSIPVCSNVQVTVDNISGFSGDINVIVVAVGYMPVAFTLDTGSTSVSFPMGYPSGTQVTLSVHDQHGNSAGAIGPYTMTTGSDSCSYTSPGTSAISATVLSSSSCDPFSASTSGNSGSVEWNFLQPYPAVSSAIATGFIAGLGSPSEYLSTYYAPGAQVLFWAYDYGSQTSSVVQMITVGSRSGCFANSTPTPTTPTPTPTTPAPVSPTTPSTTTTPTTPTTPHPISPSTPVNPSTPVLHPTSVNRSTKSIAGPVAGGVIGGVVLIALIICALLVLKRRGQRKAATAYDANYEPEQSFYGPGELKDPEDEFETVQTAPVAEDRSRASAYYSGHPEVAH